MGIFLRYYLIVQKLLPKKDKDTQPIKVIIVKATKISNPGMLNGR